MQPSDSFQARGEFSLQTYRLPNLADADRQLTLPEFRQSVRHTGTGYIDATRALHYDSQDSSFHAIAPDIPSTSLGYGLIPYRTLAISPRRMLPGTVVFVPMAYGVILPNGELHDGFFLASELQPEAQQNQIRIFVPGKDDPFARAGLTKQPILVYEALEPWTSAFIARFGKQARLEREKPTHRMVAAELDTMLKAASSRFPELANRIQYYAGRGLGTPYEIFLLGEGPDALYDKDPLADFSRVDCMTFCEQTLAMALSDDYTEMFETLQKIRYKSGEIAYTSRNHYTLADWLPNNGWLLVDVTPQIGGNAVRLMTKTIDRRSFFQTNGVPDSVISDSVRPESLSIAYLPTESIMAHAGNLRGGEIVSIVTSLPGIFSAHMGIIVRDRFGNVLFRHGSSSERRRAVVDEYLSDVVTRLGQSKNRVGMVFMRARPTPVPTTALGVQQ